MSALPVDLRTDSRNAPLGIDSTRPQFSWHLPVGSGPQSAHAVQVSTDRAFHPSSLVWDTGRIDSDQPFGIAYAGATLTSFQRYWWRVRVWTGGNEPTAWSEPATFETAVLDPTLWQAQWITGPAPTSTEDYRVLYLRSAIDLSAPVIRGRAYVSALGWYRFLVNGIDFTGTALVPRWTPFHDYVEHQVYDVTAAFRPGPNVAAIAVGDGRFRGRLGGTEHQAVYGRRLAGLAQLHLELADGTTVSWVTDGRWQAGTGRIITSDPKFGECVDLRVPEEDWLTAAGAPGRFAPAAVLVRHRRLIAERVAPVREVDRLPARSVTRAPSGKQIVDFGQNFAGVTRIRLAGRSGDTVRLTHSEVLGPDGELDTDYLHMLPAKSHPQCDEVILNGENNWWQPWFTIHGFRYVEIDGLHRDLDESDVEAVVLSSDLSGAGDFDCSEPRLNQLRHNVAWSLRSNFLDTPTDCPTRERSGWTGDIQVFAPTATTYVDVQAYLHRYLRNLATEQLPDGRVPMFIPSETSPTSPPHRTKLMQVAATSVGWGDAAVMLPWTLYRYYGDRHILQRQYPSMTAWVEQMARRARTKRSSRRRLRGRSDAQVDPYLLDTGFHFGEWLRPGANGWNTLHDLALHTPVVATAYLEHSARTLADTAAVLGRDSDATRHRDLADRTRHAWRTAFLHPDGRIGTDRQDDYVRALAFNLLDEHERSAAVERLVHLIEAADGHLGTGFLSTSMLLPVLVDGGRPDVAWRLLLQDTNPSWLAQVDRGATTVWETWEGYDANSRPTGSHNHYAFGAVAGFLTEHVAGLRPIEPGYRVIDVRPLIGGGLTHAKATVQTPYGPAASSWTRDGEVVDLTVTIPPGAMARVHTGDRIHDIGCGTATFTWTQAATARADVRR